MSRGTQEGARAVVRTIAALSVSLWVFGLFVVGAIVAPVVFRGFAANDAANAMTVVFRRFDRVILACAAITLACEATSALVSRPLGRLDTARGAVAIVLALLGGYHALRLSPGIADLHAHGAIRGLGEGGLQLEALHRQATTLATGQLVLGVLYVGLLFFSASATVRRQPTVSSGTPVALGSGDRDHELPASGSGSASALRLESPKDRSGNSDG